MLYTLIIAGATSFVFALASAEPEMSTNSVITDAGTRADWLCSLAVECCNVFVTMVLSSEVIL